MDKLIKGQRVEYQGKRYIVDSVGQFAVYLKYRHDSKRVKAVEWVDQWQIKRAS